jgi:uncharacterized membrane protein
MATLSAWSFDTASGADQAGYVLGRLAKAGQLAVDDAVVVYWPGASEAPRTQRQFDARPAAIGEGFWESLFGTIFDSGSASSEVRAAAMSDGGIGVEFVDGVRRALGPNSSALFVFGNVVPTDVLRRAFHGESVEVGRSEISDAQAQMLRATFNGTGV